MLDNLPVLIADEEKLTSPMENSSSSNDDRYFFLGNLKITREILKTLTRC